MNYRVEKDFEYRGFRCVVVAQRMGHRCGYVQIPKEHPYFEQPYETVDRFLEVHGGLTYAKMSEEGHMWTADDVSEELKRMADQLARVETANV